MLVQRDLEERTTHRSRTGRRENAAPTSGFCWGAAVAAPEACAARKAGSTVDNSEIVWAEATIQMSTSTAGRAASLKVSIGIRPFRSRLGRFNAGGGTKFRPFGTCDPVRRR